MSTITKEFTNEQLIEQAKKNIEVLRGAVEKIPGASDAAVIHLKLAEITLASLEAEPVAEVCEGFALRYIGHGPAPKSGVRIGDRLYSATPAPVSVPDEMDQMTCHLDGVTETYAEGWNACRAAMLHGSDGNSPVIPDCSCRTCRPVTFSDSRFVVCPECGNKRCPHANDHRNSCTGSNAPGQEGSAYPAAPQQEVKP